MQENLKYDQEGLEFLANNGAPIPGQSLTNNPDTPYPWEGETAFTEVSPAIDAFFIEVTEPETYHTLMQSLNDGMNIGDITQILLYDGFTKGLWNPDLMLLLIEPIMYMLLGLAEQAGIPDPILYRDEEKEPDDPEDQLAGLENAIQVAKDKIVPKAKKGQLPKDVEEKLKNFSPTEEAGLLAPDRIEEDSPPNLLDKEIR